MARSGRKNMIGKVLQKVGGALTDSSSNGRRSRSTQTTREGRGRKRTTKRSGKGILRRLLG